MLMTTRIPVIFAALLLALAGPSRSPGQDNAKAATRTAVLAGGCFWCIQPPFDKAPGVIRTDRRL